MTRHPSQFPISFSEWKTRRELLSMPEPQGPRTVQHLYRRKPRPARIPHAGLIAVACLITLGVLLP